MKHGTMRFSGITLHHNPHTIQITDTDELSQEFLINSYSTVFNKGNKATVIKGDGVFYGENAFEQYLIMKKLYKSSKIGALSLSGINPFYALLNELKLKCTPVDDYIEYTFTFIEVPQYMQSENSTAPEFYIAEENQDLWEVSKLFDIPIEVLVSINPHIKSPSEVSNGDKIRIRTF